MTSYEDILKVTTEIFVHHATKPGRPVAPHDHIQHDLGLDSLAIMEVVAELEDRFKMEISQEMLEHIATVEDVAKAIQKATS